MPSRRSVLATLATTSILPVTDSDSSPPLDLPDGGRIWQYHAVLAISRPDWHDTEDDREWAAGHIDDLAGYGDSEIVEMLQLCDDGVFTADDVPDDWCYNPDSVGVWF